MGRPRKQPDPIETAMEQIRYFSGEGVHYDGHALRTAVNGLAKALETKKTDRAEIIRMRIEGARLAGSIATSHGDTTTAEGLTQSEEDLGVILGALEASGSEALPVPATTTAARTSAAKSP